MAASISGLPDEVLCRILGCLTLTERCVAAGDGDGCGLGSACVTSAGGGLLPATGCRCRCSAACALVGLVQVLAKRSPAV